MARTVGIGIQDFEKIRTNNIFYADKTSFIKEWWESGDDVTLIARPRRFGKTLNMNMLDYFFSVQHAGRGDLFEGLFIWQEEAYRELQGTYPVISLSFANIKETNYESVKLRMNQLLTELYNKNRFLLKGDLLSENEKESFLAVNINMKEVEATLALHRLSDYLYRYYGKKVLILLDEYDTPMQEAYVGGYWEEVVSFIRNMFNSTFKTNPYLAKGIMTGITKVSKESVFSDLNNLKVVTTTSDEYATAFGFTEKEVFDVLEEYGFAGEKEKVKYWYDGFTFGKYTDIYNPWSIINFLDTKKFAAYWANTSSNSLVNKMIRLGNKNIKVTFEGLLKGESFSCPIDEQIVYNQLNDRENAIWSLLIASGYLKIVRYQAATEIENGGYPIYELALTNNEVRLMFYQMIVDWFGRAEGNYNSFIESMFANDIESMNAYMNDITMEVFSYFDTGKGSERMAAERFYHGFVLGLLADLRGNYVITSNRESGLGRYDVVLEPKKEADNAYILEFKVFNPKKEKSLEDTVAMALQQIEEKQYEANLIAKGIAKERIRKYGFAFEKKNVLIG